MIEETTKADFKKLSRDAQIIIGRIISASKNIKLYPSSHPITKKIIASSFGKLKETLRENDYISLSLAGNVLLINDKPARVSHKQTVDSFLTVLGKRKIGKITFIKGVDLDEFSSLIEILGLDHEDIEKKGGIKKVAAEKNIHHISISSISFGESEKSKEAGIRWRELLALIAGSDEFIQKIEKNPKEFSRIMTQSLEGEEEGEGRGAGRGEGEGEGRGEGRGVGWGSKVKQAIGKIAERLFNMYGKTDFETYTETVSRLILVLTPAMQSELLFSKPEIPFWEDVVNKVVDNITAAELGDLVAKETKKCSETMVITGEEGEPGEGRLTNINSFLSKIVDRSKRKAELLPAIRESFRREGVKETILDYMSGGRTRKELLEIIETDLMKTGIDAKALLGIKTLIQKNADIEELLKSLIDLLNHKNPDMRRSVVKSFVDLTDKLLLLGRIDLLKLIIVAFSDRLGREAEKEIFENIIDALLDLALKLIKEGKHLLAETIDDILNNYLKTLEEPERLKTVVGALSNIGDKGDQKALKYLIYAINRDVAYQIINTELAKKGGKIFSLLLHSMKHINDKITRIRVVSLLIDAAENVPNSDSFIKTYIEDPKWYVRRNIAIILGEIGGTKSFDLLSMMVQDEEHRVRVEVMQSLGKIKTQESEKVLIEGLKDQNKDVVIRILTSLRKVGSKKAIFALNDLLEKQSFLKKEKVLEIQERVIAVLCSIGGNEVANILRKVIFNKSIFGRYRYNDKIRLLCVDGLGKMDTIISKQILRRAAWLKKQEVGKRAAEIIKRASLI